MSCVTDGDSVVIKDGKVAAETMFVCSVGCSLPFIFNSIFAAAWSSMREFIGKVVFAGMVRFRCADGS